MARDTTPETGFLDHSLIESFREVINSSRIFTGHEQFKHKFNLICVFMDRIDSAVRYLNAHAEKPETEEEMIFFLVYATILRDGINKLYENIFNDHPPYILEKKYFSDAMHQYKPYFCADTCPTDDNFFDYLRAMAFAHPFCVSGRENNRPFMQKGEVHYCPHIIASSILSSICNIKDPVGIVIYSSANEESTTIVEISFSSLKGFIKSRYDSIELLTEWAKNGITEQNEKWKRVKVNRDLEPVDILRNINAILENRFECTDSINSALTCLECPLSDDRNRVNVELFRDAIIRVLPNVCDCVDSLDYEGMEEALSLLNVEPKHMHQMGSYQLEKIYSYLDCPDAAAEHTSDTYWGLMQAAAFAKEFAKKWVTIDTTHMTFDEIILLVRVACFLEAKAQTECV